MSWLCGETELATGSCCPTPALTRSLVEQADNEDREMAATSASGENLRDNLFNFLTWSIRAVSLMFEKSLLRSIPYSVHHNAQAMRRVINSSQCAKQSGFDDSRRYLAPQYAGRKRMKQNQTFIVTYLALKSALTQLQRDIAVRLGLILS